MFAAIRDLIRKRRYGEPVIVVSGLPRSGTSMIMKMFKVSGFPIYTDDLRGADDDNPAGYFEHARVMDLARESDKTWIRDARGKALKVISHLVKELPDDNYYKIILARRDLKEVVASQNTMLVRRGQPNPIDDSEAEDLYRKHLRHVAVLIDSKSNMECLTIEYLQILADPVRCAEQIAGFVGGQLDAPLMATAVDARLYRNRSSPPNAGLAPPLSQQR